MTGGWCETFSEMKRKPKRSVRGVSRAERTQRG